MTRVPFVGGNWKMNTTRASAIDLAQAVVSGATGMPIDVGVAPPFVYLDAVSQALEGSKVMLGAQDVYFQASGAFTGEISLDMLKDVGVKFVLTGHSERRHVLNESPDLIAKKAAAVYDNVPDPLYAEDIAEAIVHALELPPFVNIDLVTIKPVAQAAPHKVIRGELKSR